MRMAVAGGTGVVGTYVVQSAEAAGHTIVVLSRSSGVDLRRHEGLASALEGVEVIIDTANTNTTNRAKATAFFTEVTGRLQAVGATQGVARMITLSIVGIDRVGFGYYRAKLAQEAAALHGPVPATIVRATQFHEFPAQVLGRSRLGPIAVVPIMRIQPIAARFVGQFLVETATEAPSEHIVEIAGPEQEDLVELARRMVSQRGLHLVVLPLPMPGAAGRAMRHGGQLPLAGVRTGGPSFTDWLAGGDARKPKF